MLEYLAIFGGILIMLIVIEEIKDIGFKVKTTEKEVISEQVVTYDEFFDYWISRIDSKNEISYFDFDTNFSSISLGIVAFNEIGYVDKTVELRFSLQIRQCAELLARFENLAIRYRQVEEETQANIDERKKYYHSNEGLEETCLKLIDHFAKNDKIPEMSERLKKAIIDFFWTNYDRIPVIHKLRCSEALVRKNYKTLLIGVQILVIPSILHFFINLPISYSLVLIAKNSAIFLFGKRIYNSLRDRKREDRFSKNISESIIKLIKQFEEEMSKEVEVNDVSKEYIKSILFRISMTADKSLYNDPKTKDLIAELYSYFASCGNGFDKHYAMAKIALLEQYMYKRDGRTGFKKDFKVEIDIGEFMKRLELLGYRPGFDVLDPNIDAILKTVNRIYKNPYYDCELEVYSLLYLASLYYEAVFDEEVDAITDPDASLMEKIQEIDDRVSSKMGEAFAMEEKRQTGSIYSYTVDKSKSI